MGSTPQVYVFTAVGEGAGLYAAAKRCPACGQTKRLSDYPRNRATRSGRATYCKPCHAKRAREANVRLYGGGRAFHLRRRYGLDEVDFVWLFLKQDGRCAICTEAPAVNVDHEHGSGRVRGLLCFDCNAGLGLFEDEIDQLRKVLAYLEVSL